MKKKICMCKACDKKIWKNIIEKLNCEIMQDNVKGNSVEFFNNVKKNVRNIKSKIMNEFSSISYFYLVYSLHSRFAYVIKSFSR